MEAIHEKILEHKRRGEDAVLVTAVDKKGEGPVKVGIKMLVSASGDAIGTVGGGALEHRAREEAKALFKTRKNKLETYLLNEAEVSKKPDDMTQLPMTCGGTVTLFYEFLGVMNHIYLFGAGHVARALGHVLSTMDFHLTVIDARKEVIETYPYADERIHQGFAEFIDDKGIRDGSYVVVCTPNHEHDYHVLNKIVEYDLSPAYTGMLCSPEKLKDYIDKTYAQYGRDIDLRNFYAPVGLDTGGGSPAEIAVSIAAEILAIHHGKSGHRHMRENVHEDYRYWEDQ